MNAAATRFAGIVALAVSAQAASATLHQYTVTVDPGLERLNVSACFDGRAPPGLVADDTAVLHLETMQLRTPGAGKLKVNGWEAALSGLPDDACVDYVVQLRPETTGAQKGGPETRRVGRDLLTSIGDWLWRPAELAAGADIEIRFKLPRGVSVSAPWKMVGDGVYRLGTTPREWPGVVAFGGFEPMEINIPGARLKLMILDGPTPALRDALKRWIERAALSLTTVYGVFPVSELQVVIVPTPRGNKPVPWAYVARGGGSAIHLFIQPNYPEAEFIRDWSVVHEMSHLFLPYMEWGDAWLVEGLPTYFQNVAMARGGLIAPALHDADTLSLDDLMRGLKDLVTRARGGRLRSSEMSDPTLTVTNLGEQGAELVHGVIYPPQVALVGFGRIVERPWAVDGMLTVRPVVAVTLAADHRVSDGHRGGIFLAAIDRGLQAPETLQGGVS